MTFGEQLYLGLILAGFFSFAIVLAVTSTRTNRFMREKAAREIADHGGHDLKKAA